MPDVVKCAVGTNHRISAGVLLIAAFVFAGQGIGLLTLSDETILSMIRTGARKQRDTQQSGPFQRRLTDEELDKRIEEKKAQLLADAREKQASATVWGMKFLMTAVLVMISVGILAGRPRPTRLLAAIAGLILLLASVKVLRGIQETLQSYEVAPKGLGYTLDLLSFGLIPLAMIVCFVAASGTLWKEKAVAAKLPFLAPSGEASVPPR
jgi:hypothetical protein